MKLKLLSVLILSVLVSACGVGLDDSLGPNPDRIMKNEKNMHEYNSIKGEYTGTVTYSSGDRQPFPAQLALYWIEEVDNTTRDSDMQPAKRIVLRGRLQRVDSVGESDNMILLGNYDSTTSEIVLKPDADASSQACETGSRVPITIRGTISGEKITATVSRDGRAWGKLKASLTSKEVVQQAATDSTRAFERQRQVYNKITGTYSGSISRKNSRGQVSSDKVEFVVFVYENHTGSDERGDFCYRPVLHVNMRRDKQGEFDKVDFNDVLFDPDTAQLKTSNAAPSGGSAVQSVTLDATLADGALNGQLKTAAGLWGEVKSRLVSKDTPSPADGEESYERERRLRTYAEVIGTYRGRLSPPSGNTPEPIELVIYTIEDNQGTSANGEPVYMPELRARFRRTDFLNTEATDRLMTVRYYDESGVTKIAMSVIGGNSGPIAGAGTLSITANVSGGKIEGEVSDHRGPQGHLVITREQQ